MANFDSEIFWPCFSYRFLEKNAPKRFTTQNSRPVIDRHSRKLLDFTFLNPKFRVHRRIFMLLKVWRAETTPILGKNAPRTHGQMKIFHVGSHRFRESLQELLRELWFSNCTSCETPFREWDFAFREWIF